MDFGRMKLKWFMPNKCFEADAQQQHAAHKLGVKAHGEIILQEEAKWR